MLYRATAKNAHLDIFFTLIAAPNDLFFNQNIEKTEFQRFAVEFPEELVHSILCYFLFTAEYRFGSA